MKRNYQGSCHCGAVRFTCDLDLAAGTSRCNCSICTKTRFWKAIVKADAFELIAGAGALTDYQFGNHNIHHLFCKHCGVKAFGRGHLDEIGDFYAVSVTCLDDASISEVAEAPVRCENGRNDDWNTLLTETRHL